MLCTPKMAETSQIQPIIWTDDDAATFYLDDAELFIGTLQEIWNSQYITMWLLVMKKHSLQTLFWLQNILIYGHNGANHIDSWAYDSTEKNPEIAR